MIQHNILVVRKSGRSGRVNWPGIDFRNRKKRSALLATTIKRSILEEEREGERETFVFLRISDSVHAECI